MKAWLGCAESNDTRMNCIWGQWTTCWLGVFPAGSISKYIVGDWGESQLNHTLAQNRCSRAAVKDTAELN